MWEFICFPTFIPQHNPVPAVVPPLHHRQVRAPVRVLRHLRKVGAGLLGSIELGSLDRLMLENRLEHIESINGQIKRADESIRERASTDEDVRLLLSLTGIDVYTALLICSEIGTITRFPDYKRLVSWAGIAPRSTSLDRSPAPAR